MDNIRYYLSIFLRRLPWFLIVATIISAVSVTVAMTMPPAYESRMQLIVEDPQIPENLAASTVQTNPREQLQIMEQRLLTRSNMLDIARKLEVLPDINRMNPDQIVNAMRARTTMSMPGGRNPLPLMTVTFEAPQARTAAAVLNEYLTLIQQQDAEFRKGRAGETLAYFRQEVDRLNAELEEQSTRILEYKQANRGALPDSLEYRLSQQSNFQDRVSQIDRDIAGLKRQRERLIQIYEATGRFGPQQQVQLSPEEQRLQDLRDQLDEALLVYSESNPRVKILRARLEEAEARVAKASPDDGAEGESEDSRPAVLDIQLAEIDSRVTVLEEQKAELQEKLADLEDTIGKTPEVSITLEDLQRRYAIIQTQYNEAEQRLAQAQTGDRIETRSRGQRIAVIEQPAVPSQPTKPNRVLIAGGGSLVGILAGIGLILLIELLNNTARRPEDLVKRFNVTPLTTIPYVRTRSQVFKQRGLKLLFILVIVTGIPAAIYAVHLYYLPLDLLADRVMNKIGVRW